MLRSVSGVSGLRTRIALGAQRRRNTNAAKPRSSCAGALLGSYCCDIRLGTVNPKALKHPRPELPIWNVEIGILSSHIPL